MGADTLIGNDVYNQAGDKLGDIKEIMLDMRNGRRGATRCCPSAAFSAWERSYSPCRGVH